MAKQTQLDKFKQAARDLKTDDSEKRFNERLGKIAKAKPGALKPAPKSAKKRA
jgi:putative component of toxin-antitoxin plasmid stabilization module